MHIKRKSANFSLKHCKFSIRIFTINSELREGCFVVVGLGRQGALQADLEGRGYAGGGGGGGRAGRGLPIVLVLQFLAGDSQSSFDYYIHTFMG